MITPYHTHPSPARTAALVDAVRCRRTLAILGLHPSSDRKRWHVDAGGNR